MLVPEHLVSEVCYTTLVIFPWCNWVLYAPLTVAAPQLRQLWEEIQQRPRGILQITSHKDPASKSHQGFSLIKICFDPAAQRHEKQRRSPIQHFPFTINHIQTSCTTILTSFYREVSDFKDLKNDGVSFVMCLWEKVRFIQEESSVVPSISVCSCYCDSQTTVTLRTKASPSYMCTLSRFWGRYWWL